MLLVGCVSVSVSKIEVNPDKIRICPTRPNLLSEPTLQMATKPKFAEQEQAEKSAGVRFCFSALAVPLCLKAMTLQNGSF